MAFAPGEPVEFSATASTGSVKDGTVVAYMIGVSTVVVPAPNHERSWILPEDDSDDEGTTFDRKISQLPP